MDISDWRTQLRKGILEYCILLLVKKKDRYGYELIQEIDAYEIISAKESTIYPLLRRLLKEEYLESYWQDAVEEGLPPRKYYKITIKGVTYLELMNEDWQTLMNVIDKLK